MTVAFVLSGGAGLGAIQVGMLQALAERDVHPDLIVGTSVGALNGAFLAGHGTTPQSVEQLACVWRAVRRRSVFGVGPVGVLAGIAGRRGHLLSGRPLRRLVERHIPYDRLEDLPTPLHVVACDAVTGHEVLLSRGPLVDAVLASAAIPGVLPAVEWEGRLLIDGGIVDNTPISQALDLGASTVYVLSTGGPCALPAPPRGALGMLVHVTGMLVARRFAGEVTTLAGRGRLVVLPPPCPLDVEPMDFRHADVLIRRSLADARAFLDDADRRVVPMPLRALYPQAG